MTRGLDHIVHAVGDLDAAAEFYQRAGFKVGARNQHPWGTHNRIVQLPGFFIEILTVAEPEKIPPPESRSFSFGAFQRDYLARRQGLSMLLLESSDAAEDAKAFAAAGIGDFDVFDFSRTGRRPDGAEVKLAFSLAFACDPLSPATGFAICQHHFPENFWNPAFQLHPNGAQNVTGVAMISDHPERHGDFLKTLTGVAVLTSSPSGVIADTGRGAIMVADRATFRGRFADDAQSLDPGASFAGLRIGVADLHVCDSLLRTNGIQAERRGDALVVSPRDAFGATLIFGRADKG